MGYARVWLLSLVVFASGAVLAAPIHFNVVLPPSDRGSLDAIATSLRAVKQCGIPCVEIPATWPRIQPTATTWDFSWLDAQVDGARARGLDVVLLLGPTPVWSITYLHKPTAEEARRARPSLTAFRTYVTKVTQRYQNRVKYYRVWQRPSAGTLLAMPKDIYALYTTAAQAVHAVNPTLRVVASEPGDVELDWIAGYLKVAQGSARADILSLCPLRTAHEPRLFWWRVNVLRTRVLPAQRAPELWTEIPIDCSEIPSCLTLVAASLLEDIPAISLVAGSGCNMPLDNQQMLSGMQVFCALCGSQYTGWSQLSEGVYGGIFHGATDTTVLALPLRAHEVELIHAATPVQRGLAVPGRSVGVREINAPAQTIDVAVQATVAFSAQPALLTGVLASATPGTPAIAPERIDGDTLALDFSGERPNALHAMREFRGGHFRLGATGDHPLLSTVGDENPWIHFEVPDGFLFYNVERVPVAVSVTLAGVHKAQKTGFNLYYDALGGMKFSPWQWVDVGPDRLFTYTFQLNDASFADRDGYDFRINKGGSEEELRIVDVKVRKLR